MVDLSRRSLELLVLVILLFSAAVDAHSWVEQLMVIAPNGTFVGDPGYPRGYVPRTQAGFSDTDMTNLIPPNGRPNATKILRSDNLCKASQRKQVQNKGSPRLRASAGAAIALRFQENGHVTLPQNQPGKPHNRGTIYVYGTTQPKEDEKLLDVHKVWNKDGTGGDRRGVLLTVQNFDDGRCYQINSGKISQKRQAEFPHEADQLMGADLWCQTDVAVPEDAPSGKPYTLYWVWDWPTAPRADPALPQGKAEIYTTCMDVDVDDEVANHVQTYMRVPVGYAQGQDLNRASIPSQFAEIMGYHAAPNVGSSSSVAVPSPSPSPSPSRTAQGLPTVTVTTFLTMTKTVEPSGCPSNMHS